MRHGGNNGYRRHGCNCEPCKAAHRREITRQRNSREARLKADPTLAPHGDDSTYKNWRCRCDLCREAHSRALQRAKTARAEKPVPTSAERRRTLVLREAVTARDEVLATIAEKVWQRAQVNRECAELRAEVEAWDRYLARHRQGAA